MIHTLSLHSHRLGRQGRALLEAGNCLKQCVELWDRRGTPDRTTIQDPGGPKPPPPLHPTCYSLSVLLFRPPPPRLLAYPSSRWPLLLVHPSGSHQLLEDHSRFPPGPPCLCPSMSMTTPLTRRPAFLSTSPSFSSTLLYALQF
eukprot:531701-Pyramimonas_sp.AAC.1